MLPLAPSCAPAVLSVLVFNIEYGSDVVDFSRTVEFIESPRPTSSSVF